MGNRTYTDEMPLGATNSIRIKLIHWNGMRLGKHPEDLPKRVKNG